MAESTSRRIIAEAALARRFDHEISERASLADIPTLVSAVEAFDDSPDGDKSSTNEIEIAFDVDGIPYLLTGD